MGEFSRWGKRWFFTDCPCTILLKHCCMTCTRHRIWSADESGKLMEREKIFIAFPWLTSLWRAHHQVANILSHFLSSTWLVGWKLSAIRHSIISSTRVQYLARVSIKMTWNPIRKWSTTWWWFYPACPATLHFYPYTVLYTCTTLEHREMKVQWPKGRLQVQ